MADLTTVANVKEYLSVTHASDDALLSRLATVASAFLEAQCGRHFLTAIYSETRIGRGTRFIVPDQHPVQTVTEVKVADLVIPGASSETEDGWYLVDDVVYLRGPYRFTAGALVSLQYTAGYTTTPADLEQAAIELVALKYRERPHIGTSSQSLAGASVTFLPSLIPQSVKDVIDSYRWF